MSDYEDYLNGATNLDYSESGLEDEDEDGDGGGQGEHRIFIENIACSSLGGENSAKGGKGFPNKSTARSRSPSPVLHKRVRFDSPGPSAGGANSASEEIQTRDRALISMVTNSMRQEMRELIAESVGSRNSKELEQIKLEQRSNSIMSRAIHLSSEGAKAQFAAFAKVKANTEDARARALAGDAEGVIAALERIEGVADIRLEAIERADRSPGGWSTATIFERMVQSGDKSKAKFDKAWKEAHQEATEKRNSDPAKRSSFRGRFQRGSFRGSGSFRSVFGCFLLDSHSEIFLFLCNYLYREKRRIHSFCFKYFRSCLHETHVLR